MKGRDGREAFKPFEGTNSNQFQAAWPTVPNNLRTLRVHLQKSLIQCSTESQQLQGVKRKGIVPE